jgi:hypothetical protein
MRKCYTATAEYVTPYIQTLRTAIDMLLLKLKVALLAALVIAVLLFNSDIVYTYPSSTALQRAAKFSEHSVSPTLYAAGDTFTNISTYK